MRIRREPRDNWIRREGGIRIRREGRDENKNRGEGWE